MLTGAGAAFPYGKDPEDSHLRIAPTYPSLSEVEQASELMTVCVRLATVEHLLAKRPERSDWIKASRPSGKPAGGKL